MPILLLCEQANILGYIKTFYYIEYITHSKGKLINPRKAELSDSNSTFFNV